MYTALKTIMIEHSIPLYCKNDKDQLVLDNWHYTHPDIDTDEGKLNNLIDRIYRFDYFYNYSDDGKVYRIWSTAERDIDRQLMVMEDRDLAETLSSYRSDERAKLLTVTYPWLEAPRYSAYVNLLKEDHSPEEIGILLGVHYWIKTIQAQVYFGPLHGHVLYASDVQTTTKLIRAKEVMDSRGETYLTGVTVPDKLTKDLKVLAEILEVKGTYTKLRETFPSLDLGIHYINGFTQYRISNFYLLV